MERILLWTWLMKVAVPICRRRISPVFDVARRIRLLVVEGGVVASQTGIVLCGDRKRALSERDVSVLICAGISRELGNGIRAQGIEVISGICGPIDEVVDAYLAGRLYDARFVIPGGWRRRTRRALGEHGRNEAWVPHGTQSGK